MKQFRISMQHLHTWAGLLLGSILFVVFWTGSLSVFDAEIDRWTNPATRLSYEATAWDYDALYDQALIEVPDARTLIYILPNERRPVFRLLVIGEDGRTTLQLNPDTLQPLPENVSLGGTGFFFPFHYRLHLRWNSLGYWLVGLASMAMLALLVSGLFIHRKLVADFFTLRYSNSSGRRILDLHNLSSMIALPFHFLLPLTGIFIFYGIYFPDALDTATRSDKPAFFSEALGSLTRPESGEAAAQVSINELVTRAERLWENDGGEAAKAQLIFVSNVGDRNAVVRITESFPKDGFSMRRRVTSFDGNDGTLLSNHNPGPVRSVHAWLSGLHFVQLESWALRWLYFGAGLLGCVMIATGFQFWVAARKRRLPRQARLVDGIASASVIGVVLASGAFLIANRLLPAELELLGQSRKALEVWVFVIVWTLFGAYAARSPDAGWRTGTIACAGMAIFAVLLNQVTTGNGLWPPSAAQSPVVAVMDLTLLGSAALCLALTVRRERRADLALSQPA